MFPLLTVDTLEIFLRFHQFNLLWYHVSLLFLMVNSGHCWSHLPQNWCIWRGWGHNWKVIFWPWIWWPSKQWAEICCCSSQTVLQSRACT